MNVNNKEFLEFLVKAKKSTYANSDAPKVLPSRLKSKDYEFTDGNFTYHDTYFGGVKFMGEEVVYYNNDILWGMNYYGVTIDDSLTEEVMDKVLRVALMKVGEDKEVIPVRGPKEFINEDYLYIFNVDGDMENFVGTEQIYKDKKLIYELKCHGGIIK
ncbi:MAG TPA: XRE family transcriptional regulator [Candidatus Onthousia excrementipullorum]|uniref:XRE family transcriptional regulator n=1 Tax=Candidatus Onthousia excrementipullorum TaxID=2840884 RepID=A0A9D1DVK6_9FIRM|nr:XRE family transcriptional regulator [Candidatus Onthousia excrementipullorum]